MMHALVCGLLLAAPDRPDIVLILADDLGYSDLGCYGGEVPTPNLDRLAAQGTRFRQFYNCGRCCPTRAALLTGRYPHQVGVGHMLQPWKPPAYDKALQLSAPTLAQQLRPAGYRCYLSGKWHTGPVQPMDANSPLRRGFDHFYGTLGGGNFFRPTPLLDDAVNIRPEPGHYFTTSLTTAALRFLDEHQAKHAGDPLFLHLCHTAPHFPLQAPPADIARHRGKYRDGWDTLRAKRFESQKRLGVVAASAVLSVRNPIARPWTEVPAAERDEWDGRMATHAAMVEIMDREIGRVLAWFDTHRPGRPRMVFFISDNGASAEALDSWPNPARGHKPGAAIGSADSHRCLEIGWANAANTPFREQKMWAHQGGIRTPMIAWGPGVVHGQGAWTDAVGHVIDFAATLRELAGLPANPTTEGTSLLPVLTGDKPAPRTLGWEHEGNRTLRNGDWKLVAEWRKDWELFDLSTDPAETRNLAAAQPERVAALAAGWQKWANRVGVLPWEQLPGSRYKPTPGYRKRSEPVGM